jgi:hypothetical protein
MRSRCPRERLDDPAVRSGRPAEASREDEAGRARRRAEQNASVAEEANAVAGRAGGRPPRPDPGRHESHNSGPRAGAGARLAARLRSPTFGNSPGGLGANVPRDMRSSCFARDADTCRRGRPASGSGIRGRRKLDQLVGQRPATVLADRREHEPGDECGCQCETRADSAPGSPGPRRDSRNDRGRRLR